MKNSFKKYFLISFFINAILFFLIYKIYFYENLDFTKNIVSIEKQESIVNFYQNPNSIFLEEENISSSNFKGFFISKNKIISVYHGINPKQKYYRVKDFLGNNFDAELINFDKTRDLAFLNTKKDFKYFSKIKIKQENKVYQKIFYLKDGKKIFGEIVKLEKGKIYTDIIFQLGDSGSPVFTKKNKLIGLVEGVNLEKNLGLVLPLKTLE